MMAVVGFAGALREMKQNISVLQKQNFYWCQNSKSDEHLNLINL